MSFAVLYETVRSCTKCALHLERTQAVPGEGNERAEVMFIGEGPGKNEDLQGRPFVGAAGKLLDKLLELVHMKREDVYITNVVKCRPPGNRDPMPEEKLACRPYLDEQVARIDPKLIVLLGRHAMANFFPDLKISQVHGKALRRDGRVYMPLFHPAAALYRQELKETLAFDFQKIPHILKKLS